MVSDTLAVVSNLSATTRLEVGHEAFVNRVPSSLAPFRRFSNPGEETKEKQIRPYLQ